MIIQIKTVDYEQLTFIVELFIIPRQADTTPLPLFFIFFYQHLLFSVAVWLPLGTFWQSFMKIGSYGYKVRRHKHHEVNSFLNKNVRFHLFFGEKVYKPQKASV